MRHRRLTDEELKAALDRIDKRSKGLDTSKRYSPLFIKALESSPVLQRYMQATTERLQQAKASGYKTATFDGKLAIAESTHPLQRTISLTLLPLNVANANKQAIPDSEADNILRYAPYSPIRVMFDGEEVLGHNGAVDVGVLHEVWKADSEILARGVLWSENNTPFISYLEKNGSVGSSYEIFYGSSKVVDGIEYLYDTIFAAQAIVSNPAYGDRTRVVLK